MTDEIKEDCKIRTVKDVMRGNGDSEVIVKFNPSDVIVLSCSCDYYGDSSGEVSLVKDVKVREGDSWIQYPVVSYQKGEITQTVAFVMTEEGPCVMCSPNNLSDEELFLAAENKNLIVQRIGFEN